MANCISISCNNHVRKRVIINGTKRYSHLAQMRRNGVPVASVSGTRKIRAVSVVSRVF